jgi:DNA-binding NtrC family response regulator
LVDGNRMGVAARKTFLRENSYEVLTASNTEDALQVLATHPVDVLVTEFRIQKLGGLEFIRQAREAHPALAVVVLSGFADALGLHEANTGADVVLQKSSLELQQLQRAVKRLLGKKPARKPAGRAKGTDKSQSAAAGSSNARTKP